MDLVVLLMKLRLEKGMQLRTQIFKKNKEKGLNKSLFSFYYCLILQEHYSPFYPLY